MFSLVGYGLSHRETCRYRKESGDVDLSESETGSEEDATRNRLLFKQVWGNPVHPVNQTAREVQKLKG